MGSENLKPNKLPNNNESDLLCELKDNDLLTVSLFFIVILESNQLFKVFFLIVTAIPWTH